MNSVAISASNKKVSFLCEPLYRDLTRTAYKCSIMVRPFVPTEPKEEDVEMPQAGEEGLPDFGDDDLDQNRQPPPLTDDDVRDKYKFPTWEKADENLKSMIRVTDVHPVDPICVACKVTPIPIKDLDPNLWLNKISPDGWYKGNSIHNALASQEHRVEIENKVVVTSRWSALLLSLIHI